jgi:hypothetical protein
MMRLIFILLISVSLHCSTFAQPWPNDPWGNGTSGSGAGTDPGGFGTQGGDPQEEGFPDPDLPLDSNVLILVGAVVCYGLKKVWDVKRNSKRKNNLASTAGFKDFIQ